MKLHLGCGDVRIPGYVNVDIMPGPAVDELWNIRNMPIEDGSVDVIYACSVLEHFGRTEWQRVVGYWYQLLTPGGVLRLSVPNFDACVMQYYEHGDLAELLGLLIGGQKNKHDWHGMIFNKSVLFDGLVEVGFTDVRHYNWREVEPGCLGIDDYSQAYLPHMDKQHGRLMMLNVEARK